MGPPGPAGAVQMAVLRGRVAHTLSGVAAILFELFGSFGTVFSGPLGRFLQPLLPVGVQTVSIIPWALLELHQLLRDHDDGFALFSHLVHELVDVLLYLDINASRRAV